MKVMITGAAGMLGQDLIPVLNDEEVLPVDITGDTIRMDITDLNAVMQVVSKARPNVVIHLAAYTNVDGCTTDPQTAWQINAGGTWNLASACQQTGAAMVYISTDFVFDGAKRVPYDEFDSPNPISIYGRTKYAGEVFVQKMVPNSYIVRTAWLYGPLGKSFPRTMIRMASEGKAIRVVGDQVGSPTYTVDLAQAISRIIRQPLYGIYHVTNSGACSWYDFAKAAIEGYGIAGAELTAIASEGWPSPTKRPSYSVMEHRALSLASLPGMRPWRDALQDFLIRLRTDT